MEIGYNPNSQFNDMPNGVFFDGHRPAPYEVIIELAAGAEGLSIAEVKGEVLAVWPMEELRRIPDQAWRHGMVLTHVTEDLPRLLLKNQELEMQIRRLAKNLNKRKPVPGIMWRLLGWGGGAVASVFVILFLLIPALSDRLAEKIPPEKEIALGQQTLTQIEGFLGGTEDKPLICDTPAGSDALAKMVARLEKQSQSPYPLKVQTFNNEMINAFAVPGGHIVLFDGLLASADTPEEVAGVLAHEIGHVVHRDPVRLTLRSAGSVGILGLVFGDFAGGAVALIVVEQLMAASYSQEAEAGADGFAHQLLADAGLPARAFAQFFLKLKAEYGDDQGLLSHLASHPDLNGRADAAIAADVIGDGNFDSVLTAQEWADLKAICKPAKNEKKEP